MIVGGREFESDKAGVETRMRGVTPDDIRSYYVWVNGVRYPPKQVLANVTGWPRTSFTTMEAQRVLNKIGFPSNTAETQKLDEPSSPVGETGDRHSEPHDRARIAALEAGLTTAMEAIAGLAARVRTLEQETA